MSDGLEGVVAAETTLSHVDGEAGRLILRGHEIEDLAGRISFEAAVALLWEGLLERPLDEQGLRQALGEARVEADRLARPLYARLGDVAPMEALRLLLAALPDQSSLPAPILLTGAVPVYAAASARLRRGEQPLVPGPARGQAEDCLRLLCGSPGSAAAVAALEAYLITIMDHGLNASTFAARIVASTRAELTASVLAAFCALSGPLHGGAPGPVLDMLNHIGEARRARAWLSEALARGERLMGFGHRVYRVRDPRANLLKEQLRRVAAGTDRLALAEAVEAEALALLAERQPGRPLHTNVEFYTALLLEALEVPRDSFTPVFAIGRTPGWIAHALEQSANGRLLRPQSRYVGPLPAAA